MHRAKVPRDLSLAKDDEHGTGTQAVKYGLLANKNSLLFTKLPNSLFSPSTTPMTPPSSPIDGAFVAAQNSKCSSCCAVHDAEVGMARKASTASLTSSASFLSLSSWASTSTKCSSLFSSFSSARTPSKSASSRQPHHQLPAPAQPHSFSVAPANLGGSPLCPNQLAILDLVTYYDVVNLCVSARTSPLVRINHADVTYTDSLVRSSFSCVEEECDTLGEAPRSREMGAGGQAVARRKNTRRIRKFLMAPDVSLNCFERKFLYKLMLECFESPFDDEFEYTPAPGPRRASAPGIMDADQSLAESSAGASTTTCLSSRESLDKLEGDACLHVELVHPVEHGHLNDLLRNILKTSKTADEEAAKECEERRSKNGSAGAMSSYTTPQMTMTAAKKRQVYVGRTGPVGASRAALERNALRYQSFDESLMRGSSSGASVAGNPPGVVGSGLRGTRNAWGKRIAIF